MTATSRKCAWVALLVLTAALGLYVRTAGVFRGLETDNAFHPDEPKQVAALENYLRGTYVWYTGSVYYDGYPYGLNHIDEWLLRPAFLARRGVRALLHGRGVPSATPSRRELYFWARGLRVIYGALVLLMGYAIGTRLFPDRRSRWTLLLLLCLAPLSTAVTHYATGDIGTDLFGAVALLCLCLYATRANPLYVLLAGLGTGMAFGCKYNGLLCGLPIALYAAMELATSRRPLRFLRDGATALLGCVLGIVVTTPAFLVKFDRTRDDVLANLAFIRDYSVSDQELALPFHEKAVLSLTRNLPRLLEGFGWVLMALAVVALVATLMRYRRHGQDDPPAHAMNRVLVALSAYPFVALLLSLMGKLEVQPFHFSYLVLPLSVAAVAGLRAIRAVRWRHGGLLAWACSLALLLELGHAAAREAFFWQRDDNLFFDHDFAATVLEDPTTHTGHILRHVQLEPRNVSEFRNRKLLARSPHAETWKRMGCAPVPCVPFPVRSDWIFMNGPLFPRNDRMFVVRAGTTCERYLVFPNRPDDVVIGLRSAGSPTRATIRLGGRRHATDLTVHEQATIRLAPRRMTSYRFKDEDRAAHLVRLSVAADTGDVVITCFSAAAEQARFACFGGADVTPATLTNGLLKTTETVNAVAGARFMEGTAAHKVLDAEHSDDRGLAIPGDGMFLPAGRYVARIALEVLSERVVLAVGLEGSTTANPSAGNALTVARTRGHHTITQHLEKVFAPYACDLRVRCRQGRCQLGRWTVAPDTAAVLEDLAHWQADGTRPSWAHRMPAGDTWSLPDTPLDITLDNALHLKRLTFPATLAERDAFRVECDVTVARHPWKGDGKAIFIHILDAEGHLVCAMDLLMDDAFAACAARRPVVLRDAIGLPPGTYAVHAGLWSGIAQRRLALDGPALTRRERRKRRFLLGSFTVEPAIRTRTAAPGQK